MQYKDKVYIKKDNERIYFNSMLLEYIVIAQIRYINQHFLLLQNNAELCIT